MNTFKIETTQTEKRTINLEFEVPSFYKHPYGGVLGIIGEENIYRAYHSEKYSNTSNGDSERMASDLIDAVKGERITEEEFMAVYNAARKATDLTPHIGFYATSEGITNRITE